MSTFVAAEGEAIVGVSRSDGDVEAIILRADDEMHTFLLNRSLLLVHRR